MKKDSGVTLIELIAVIGIIGIIYLISAPLYRNFQTTMVLKSASQGIKNYIELAKSKALNLNRKYTITFDIGNQKLTTTSETVDEGGDTALTGIADYIAPRQITLSLNNTTHNKLDISSAGSITFSDSSGDTIGSNSIWIQKTGTTRYYTITTESATGAVRIYNYKN